MRKKSLLVAVILVVLSSLITGCGVVQKVSEYDAVVADLGGKTLTL